MERIIEEDMTSQVSETGTIIREMDTTNGTQVLLSDTDSDWEEISRESGKTPVNRMNDQVLDQDEIFNNLTMTGSFVTVDEAALSPKPETNHAKEEIQNKDSDDGVYSTAGGDEDDDSDEELGVESKSLPSDEEDESEAGIRQTIQQPKVEEGYYTEGSEMPSPIVNENYLTRTMEMPEVINLDFIYDVQEDTHEVVMEEDVDQQCTVEPDEGTAEPFADDKDCLTLIEMLRTTPPPQLTTPTATQVSEESNNRWQLDTRLEQARIVGIRILQSASEMLIQMISSTSFSNGCKTLAYALAFYGLPILLTACVMSLMPSENPSKVSRPGVRPVNHPRQFDVDVPRSFTKAFAREVASCEGMCCFSLFILTGDSSAHDRALLKVMQSTSRYRNKGEIDVWTADKLVTWTKGSFEAWDDVVLVRNADELDTKDVQRVLKYGQRGCREGNVAQPRIVVLSTSFGSDRLNDPDEVLSDKFVDEFKRRDWLAVPEIVLNRHGIIHGIRGRKPQSVFETFLKVHRKSAPTIQDPHPSWIFSWFWGSLIGTSSSSTSLEVVDESFLMQRPLQALDKWLETKRTGFAWTESAKRILATKVQQTRPLTQARAWLDHQYNVWTRNGSCESVLFRSSPSDVRAFNVACSGSTASARSVM